jgi:hypothetical protein
VCTSAPHLHASCGQIGLATARTEGVSLLPRVGSWQGLHSLFGGLDIGVPHGTSCHDVGVPGLSRRVLLCWCSVGLLLLLSGSRAILEQIASVAILIAPVTRIVVMR